MSDTNGARILAVKVPERQRTRTLPALFGAKCVQIEGAIFAWADKLIVGYGGAYWEFFKLSNGGFFMVPQIAEPVRVRVAGNGYEGEMSNSAAGIVCCLFAYSHESFSASGAYREALIDQFYKLRAYAAEHDEAGAILAAID